MTPRWYFGRKFAGGKRPLWTNVWMAHPCTDLALAFELGTRAWSHR